jgi:hypothetical protein
METINIDSLSMPASRIALRYLGNGLVDVGQQ